MTPIHRALRTGCSASPKLLAGSAARALISTAATSAGRVHLRAARAASGHRVASRPASSRRATSTTMTTVVTTTAGTIQPWIADTAQPSSTILDHVLSEPWLNHEPFPDHLTRNRPGHGLG